jgi:hypothetical protein
MMESEIEIQARLKCLMVQTYGAEAEVALRRLSMFLTERFGGPAIKVFAPHHPDHYIQTTDYLIERAFIYKISHVKGEYEKWREKYRPWDNNNFYWIDPEVIRHYYPAPTEDEKRFALHAAFIFTFNGRVSKKTFDTYLHLMSWVQEYKPDIALAFAEQVIKRYGGSDPRLYEKFYNLAQSRHLVGEKVRIIWQLSEIALHENNIALAAERCHQVLTLGTPETDPGVAYPHIRTLEILGRIAENEAQWQQARAFYERSLLLRDRILHKLPHLHLLLALRNVTQMQGDIKASKEYTKRIKELPKYQWDYLKLDESTPTCNLMRWFRDKDAK